MNSSLSYNDKHERIWIDDFGPFVFAKVNRLATSDQMKSANMKTIEAIRHQVKKFKFVYFILDTTETEDLSMVTLIDYCTHCLADQFKAGLEYAAFLTPKNSSAASTLQSALRTLPLRSAIGIHDSFERALHHTTRLWQDRMGQVG
jgi:hypothetical protein